LFHSVTKKILIILTSAKFIYVVVGVLIIGAGWMALTASYPMAFDEGFHVSVIKVYAQHLSPILNTSLPSYAQYGGLVHDPSYLYHYLMSFPFRLISLFTENDIYQVIFIRFINIGIFVAGLFAFRRLLTRVGISSALTHLSLLLLVLLPVTPFLAATVNYDNLLFLMVPITLSIAYTCITSITKKGQLSAKSLALLISVGALSSLVKYAFLPIFVAIVLYIVIILIRSKKRTSIAKSIWVSFKQFKLSVKVSLILLLTVASGLFLQRYAVNIIEYHNINPDCSKVQTVDDCLTYGPWARNYKLQKAAVDNDSSVAVIDQLSFPLNWAHDMIYRLYFAINYDFREYAPMPLPIAMAYIVGGIGIILAIASRRAIFAVNRHIWLFVAVIVIYTTSLFYVNFTEYLKFDTMVAINGRYFILLLPLVFVILGLAYRRFITKFWPRRQTVIKVSMAVVAVLISLQGGGSLTYLIYSKSVWYIPNDPLTSFNVAAQKVTTTLVIGAQK
jgi:hypothetical protein